MTNLGSLVISIMGVIVLSPVCDVDLKHFFLLPFYQFINKQSNFPTKKYFVKRIGRGYPNYLMHSCRAGPTASDLVGTKEGC